MKLRNYQQIITKNIDSRFRGSAEESRRFVGVKLPTGGGKSFIFMDQLEKVMDEYNSQNENDDSSKLSDVSVKFLAPLNGIIIQTQTNVAKYIILERYIENFQKNNNEINEQNINQAIKEITERMLKSSEIKGKEKKLIIEKINSISIDENNSNEETLRKFLYKVLNLISKKIPVLVKSEFPKVEFICYQNENILKLEEENRESWEETKLVVFDEAHRTGADVWGENVQNLIRTLSDCKFLAITATPERDIDGKDSMADLANIAGYSTRECRKKEYLASDMNLVTALSSNPPLVLKPKVVNFDCMLDRTKEYQDMKTFLDSRKKKANDATIRNGKFTDEYHVLLVNFLTMCKLSGKLDFLKMHLNDSKLEDVLVKFINGEDITSYRRELGEIKEKVYEIDDPKSDLHKEYEEDREKKILDIIKNANCPVGKYICFAPTAKKQAESKEIMESHKAIIQEFLDLPEDKVMITHSNPKVIKPKQDKENLEDFINSSNENIAIVAMDKFNEGMHVDGVVGSFMFRQIDDRGNQSESKEEPKIMFLQQIGRTIRSVDPNNSEQEAPIIFDLACNFMRYNDKLNGIFNISEAQSEFKSLYDVILRES